MTPAALLDAGVDALGLGDQLPEESRARLMDYLQLLQKWNRTYNLTAIREPERMVSHHLLDSLTILPYGLASPLLDVGSGAGLPGIPLAIARPDLEVTLLDAVEKKCAFLRQAGAQLGLSNVRVVHARVEAWQPVTPFQRVVSRAFSDLGELVRLTRHLLATGGQWLAMKGARPDEELAALQGAHPVAVHALQVPGLDARRHLVILEAA